jgi:hypothetical protein
MNPNKRIRLVAGIVVLALVIGGGIWFSRRGQKEEETVAPEIILEESKLMTEPLRLPLSEAEKQQIDEVFAKEGAEMTALKDVTGGAALGSAWRHFDGKKFYHKVEVQGLPALEKGFYYEAWLVGKTGFFSTGRLAVLADGSGKLYYTSDEDKRDFPGVVITNEPEDGDPRPAEHVLEGSF